MTAAELNEQDCNERKKKQKVKNVGCLGILPYLDIELLPLWQSDNKQKKNFLLITPFRNHPLNEEHRIGSHILSPIFLVYRTAALLLL